MKSPGRTKRLAAGAALVLAGFGVGAAVAVTGSASAATDAVSTGVGQAAQKLDPTKSIRPDEHLLTGTTAAKVRAAAVAKYPNADHPAGGDRLRRCLRGAHRHLGGRAADRPGREGLHGHGHRHHGGPRWPGWPRRRPRRTAGLDRRQRRLTAPDVRRPAVRTGRRGAHPGPDGVLGVPAAPGHGLQARLRHPPRGPLPCRGEVPPTGLEHRVQPSVGERALPACWAASASATSRARATTESWCWPSTDCTFRARPTSRVASLPNTGSRDSAA